MRLVLDTAYRTRLKHNVRALKRVKFLYGRCSLQFARELRSILPNMLTASDGHCRRWRMRCISSRSVAFRRTVQLVTFSAGRAWTKTFLFSHARKLSRCQFNKATLCYFRKRFWFSSPTNVMFFLLLLSKCNHDRREPNHAVRRHRCVFSNPSRNSTVFLEICAKIKHLRLFPVSGHSLKKFEHFRQKPRRFASTFDVTWNRSKSEVPKR